MTATGRAIMEVDPGPIAGTAVDRFLDEPLARGLNGEIAVDHFLDGPSDGAPAGEMLQHDLAQACAGGRSAVD